MMRHLLPAMAAMVLAMTFISCEGGGNSGSETTNGLTGVVKDVEGRTVAGARVLLLSEEYDPGGADGIGLPKAAVTDAKGVYSIKDVAPGRYHLQLSDSVHGTLSLIQNVTVSPAGEFATVNGTLGMPGELKVRIVDFLGAGETGYIYIPGTTVLLRVDSAARGTAMAELKPVPVGRFDRLLLVVNASADRKIITLARDFEVFAETSSAPSPFQTWKHSRRIPVNTAALGVAGTVTDFPLLVRLTETDFDFSQAHPNGQDIRFSKADGSAIPYQIERWNVVSKRAEIWARLDTVAGASADQYINMHWGRGLTTVEIPGPKVFDASAGFATVYHLDEAANSDAGGYKDATPSANHATAAGINPNAQVPGIVAGAKAFAGQPLSVLGTLSAAMPPGFEGNSGFTVSFWMRFDTTATRQTILDFGSYANLRNAHFLIRPDTTAQFGPFDGDLTSGTDPATWQNVFSLSPHMGKWTHLATVYDPANSTLVTYINGKAVSESPTSPLRLEAGTGLRIGKSIGSHPKDFPFNGALDEIRFCVRSLSADRIKLDYETQKP